jgi:hypothetical protein
LPNQIIEIEPLLLGKTAAQAESRRVELPSGRALHNGEDREMRQGARLAAGLSRISP